MADGRSGARPSLPSCHREQSDKARAGSGGGWLGPGGLGKLLRVPGSLLLPHPPNTALSVTPSFQNTPFGASQLWASVPHLSKRCGLISGPPHSKDLRKEPGCQRPVGWALNNLQKAQPQQDTGRPSLRTSIRQGLLTHLLLAPCHWGGSFSRLASLLAAPSATRSICRFW